MVSNKNPCISEKTRAMEHQTSWSPPAGGCSNVSLPYAHTGNWSIDHKTPIIGTHTPSYFCLCGDFRVHNTLARSLLESIGCLSWHVCETGRCEFMFSFFAVRHLWSTWTPIHYFTATQRRRKASIKEKSGIELAGYFSRRQKWMDTDWCGEVLHSQKCFKST